MGAALVTLVTPILPYALAFAAGAMMSEALARRGFARGDATTRMARRDPACGGARAIAEPGTPGRALTVASLDLG